MPQSDNRRKHDKESFNKRYIESINRIYEKIFHRRFLIIYFIILSLIFIYIIYRASSSIPSSLLTKNIFILAIVIALSLIFIILKALSLKVSLNSQGIKYSSFSSMKLFLLSTFIEITLFPSKLASDIFKYKYMGNIGKDRTNKIPSPRQRLYAIIFFRFGLVLSFIIFLLAYLFFKNIAIGIAAMVLIIILALAAGHISKRFPKIRKYLEMIRFIHERPGALAYLILLTIASTIIDILRAYLLLSIFGFPASIDFFFAFLFINTLGVLSNIPFGFGIKDLSLFIYLGYYLNAAQIGIFLLLTRLFGELFSGIIGWALFIREFRTKGQK